MSDGRWTSLSGENVNNKEAPTEQGLQDRLNKLRSIKRGRQVQGRPRVQFEKGRLLRTKAGWAHGQEHGGWIQTAWLCILAAPLINWATFGQVT